MSNAGVATHGSTILTDLEAALPGGLTLRQAASRIADGVCEAYAAYNNGRNLTPKLPGYHAINEIKVWESDPNGNPFSGMTSQRASDADETAESQPAAYASRPGAAPPPCTGPWPQGTPSIGHQLFGFTATANDLSHNILVFRGTVTMQEAVADLIGWGKNKQCKLPSQLPFKKSFGLVNSALYDFYVGNDDGAVTSLAASCMQAIGKTWAYNKSGAWYAGGHSLGGAMITLATLDGVVSDAFGTNVQPIVFTFGSLHVGVEAFAAEYRKKVNVCVRFANLCDFVPSMVSLEPVVLNPPYVHVGVEATFIWQTWDDWGNHSLATIYKPMIQNDKYWPLIFWGPRSYPVGIDLLPS